MDDHAYRWRHLTSDQRAELLAWRQKHRRPWHAPPHLPNFDNRQFHVTAACFDHVPHIGRCPARMDAFSEALLDAVAQQGAKTIAWCVLPNHYHLLVETDAIRRLVAGLGRLHGRTSHAWNGEEDARGRQVFYGAADRFMRSDRHAFATVNYIHHNPVHHGYVERWTEWPWSSAAEYLVRVGRAEAERVWREHPVRGYGKGWDDAGL